MKIMFRDNMKSYSCVFCLGILAGLSVVFFSGFPRDDLWALSYWSSETLGFWMFSTSLIVLFSEKIRVAIINTIVYIFNMFIITEIYKTLRNYFDGYEDYNNLLEVIATNVFDWFVYGIVPALICGVLGAVLWNGRKYSNIFGKMLCVMPLVFIALETISLIKIFIVEHTRLFVVIVDLLCLITYYVIYEKYMVRKK